MKFFEDRKNKIILNHKYSVKISVKKSLKKKEDR